MSEQNRLKRQFVRSNKKKTPKEALSNSKGLKSDQYLCLLQMYCKLIIFDPSGYLRQSTTAYNVFKYYKERHT